MFDAKKAGDQIASLRKKNGMTQEELAEKMNVSPQAVSKWENGNAMPEVALLTALSELMNCSIDDILFPKDSIGYEYLVLPKAPQAKKILEKCKIKKSTKVDLSTMIASESNAGRMWISDNNGIFKYDKITEELIISKGDSYAISEKEYRNPLKINFLAKTDNTNLRLYFGGYSLIFNWECKKHEIRINDPVLRTTIGISDFGKIPENEYVEVAWIILKERVELYVNKKIIYSFEYRDYSDNSIISKIGIGSAYGSVVTVKKIEVVKDNILEQIDLSKMKLHESEYYMKDSELVVFSENDRYAVSTVDQFTLPIKVDLYAKVDDMNLRIYYHGGNITLNWECDKRCLCHNDITGKMFSPYNYGGYITPNEYHHISWIIHKEFTALIIDDVTRFYSEDYPYISELKDKFINDTVRLSSAFGGKLTIKSLTVSELE